MKPLIVGVSGKKQSGKSSLCDFLNVWYKVNLHNSPYTILQDISGKIELFHWDDEIIPGDGFAFSSVEEDLAVEEKQSVKVYNFADALKDVCHKVLGLTKEQCYGTDSQKNSLSQYTWDNMPVEIRLAYSNSSAKWVTGSFTDTTGEKVETLYEEIDYPVYRSGPMTGREVMQVVGTDIFRKMFSDQVWVNATFNRIKEENKPISLIADCRFESEVKAIIDNGGYIIRLNRVVDGSDLHPSETALDNFDFASLGNRCLELNNDELEINAKNELAANWIDKVMKGLV
jgi:hypothetical protein